MPRSLTALLFACGVLIGCSVPKEPSIAESKVPEFHSMLDAGEARAIYAASSDELKKAASEKDFLTLLDAVHRKLGVVKTSTRQTWNVNRSTSGTFVMLTYKTEFTDGEATEQFLYRILNDQALLAGYHVNSLALIAK